MAGYTIMAGNVMDSEEKLKIIVREAVGHAVKETLLSLGIDSADAIKTQKRMQSLSEISDMLNDEEFQADLIHLRRWRKSIDQVSSVSIRTAVGILVTGVFGTIIFAVKVWLGK